MSMYSVEIEINGVRISLETGRLARQAHGSAVARIADTMVLATACEGEPPENADFFPLTVEYVEKGYAAGKIPGGFVKREGKPSTKEVLSARIVDRPIRPMFPKGYMNEVQIINTVISADDNYNPDVMAITASSCALCLSPIPFTEPIAGVRVGMVNNKLKVFPTLEETETGTLDLSVAGSETSIVMVEGGCREVPEEIICEAIALAHEEIKKLVTLQKELIDKVKPTKRQFIPPAINEELFAAVYEKVKDTIHEISFSGNKVERYTKLEELLKSVQSSLAEQFPQQEKTIAEYFRQIEVNDIRSTILEKNIRIGGRGCDELREITCELDIIPRAHGSALFTRGETQALVVTTLGTKLDEQIVDTIQEEYSKSYMLHYNFPPFSVGEVKRLGSPSRREIGHGHLAERSLAPVLPAEQSFPYTIRVVSEILESNGSSSMASICGGSLSLMAAGVPIKAPVAGVAMGLIKEGDRLAILTDILGTEDHVGDMDFKVAGTREGVCGIQMDIKVPGITQQLMKEALVKARVARLKILDIMDKTIAKSRKELSPYAPRILTLSINKDKIREVIGTGGKVIRDIQERTGTTINIDDDGTVQIASSNQKNAEEALKIIQGIVTEPELGQIYEGVVKSIVDFGAFVEFLPGKEGLVHISELDKRRTERVEDIVKEGDKIKVKLIGFDRFGKVKLSRKALL